MVGWERRHLPQKTWYHKRPSGGHVELPVEDCCIALENDPGDGSEVILLELDTDGTSCIEPQSCGVPPAESLILLEDDPGDESLIVLLQSDIDGTSGVELEGF